MTTLTSTQPPAGVAHRLQGRTRAATNFAIFAAVAVTIGWAGIALDRAMDEPRGNSLGMALWLVLPALTAVLLVRRALTAADRSGSRSASRSARAGSRSRPSSMCRLPR